MNRHDLVRKPSGLSAYTERVFDVLCAFTTFPWAILDAQATRIGLDPYNLTPEGLRQLAPRVADAVARFSEPGVGPRVRDALLALT